MSIWYHIRSLLVLVLFSPIIGFGIFQASKMFHQGLDLMGAAFFIISILMFLVGALSFFGDWEF